MVKTGKKTTTEKLNDKNKENPEVFVLMRDIVSNTHHIIQRSKLITSKKLEKLHAGDEVSFGQRNNRIRCTILMIGKIYLSPHVERPIFFVLGARNQCEKSLIIIEKASASKKKANKVPEQKVVEHDSDQESITSLQIHESEEEVNSGDENEVLHHDEEQILKNIPVSNSSSNSRSTIISQFCFQSFSNEDYLLIFRRNGGR